MQDSASSTSDTIPRGRKHHCTYAVQRNIVHKILGRVQFDQQQIASEPRYCKRLQILRVQC
jgi:hypothetical protein